MVFISVESIKNIHIVFGVLEGRATIPIMNFAIFIFDDKLIMVLKIYVIYKSNDCNANILV